MFKRILLIIWMIFISLQTVNAATNVWWSITTNTTWTLANSPYVVTSSLILASWKTLTIEAWTVIKMKTGVWLTIYWKLLSLWTSWNKVVFTSYKDDSVWWDTNLDGTSTSPSRWDWGTMQIYWVWSNWSIIDYTDIKYWWYNHASYGAIRIDTSNVQIKNSLITENKTQWIYIWSWSPTISNTIVSNSNNEWIYVYNWTPNINNSTISWNTLNWIYVYWTSTIQPTPTIVNNTMSWNGWYWIYDLFWSNITFTNNKILNNSKIIYSPNLDLFLKKSNSTISWNTSKSLEVRSFNMKYTSSWTLQKDWSDYDLVLLNSIILASWKTLTIEAWTVIKMKTGVWLTIYWKLLSLWTSWNKVVFTSYNDNNIWSPIWTGGPSRWDWGTMQIYWAWSNWSIIDYTDIKYWWYNHASYGAIRIDTSNVQIKNSLITENKTQWIYIWSWNPTISNTIVSNSNNYWIYKYNWTPNLSYNLYYLNTSWNAFGFTIWANSLQTNPLFVDTKNYKLSSSSPAINAWNPSYWNHPNSWDRYDIWSNEYNWYLDLVYSADVTWITWSSTYVWDFTQDPTSWSQVPVLSSPSWNINSDWLLNTTFMVKKLWLYKLRLSVKDSSWTVIWTNNITFTIQ